MASRTGPSRSASAIAVGDRVDEVGDLGPQRGQPEMVEQALQPRPGPLDRRVHARTDELLGLLVGQLDEGGDHGLDLGHVDQVDQVVGPADFGSQLGQELENAVLAPGQGGADGGQTAQSAVQVQPVEPVRDRGQVGVEHGHGVGPGPVDVGQGPGQGGRVGAGCGRGDRVERGDQTRGPALGQGDGEGAGGDGV